jgi:hypothetical protein
MRLTIERAVVVGREFGGWFGTPLLARCAPRSIKRAEDILDGRVRFEAMGKQLDPPCLVFPLGHRKGLYSIGTRQYLLPRLLLLCGHPDRAWRHTPECWRDSVQALESFLGVERAAALEVWAAGKEIIAQEKGKLLAARRAPRRAPHERQTTHQIVLAIRMGLRARSEGDSFDLSDVEELVGFK